MSQRVLLVEDDLGIQAYCKAELEKAGITVAACETAADARRLFAERRPDLAVLDYGLPDATGIDLIKEWHAYNGPKVPVLFLTARGDLKTRLECFQAGAVDYVHKPFAAEELIARAKVHLGVKKSTEELVRKNYELELLGRARQDMTDMIVHDLKAPLTAIKGTIDLIHSRGLISEDAYASLLSNAGSAADFMLLMLNDMLDVAQAKNKGGLPVDIAYVEPQKVFAKIQSLFAGRSKLTGSPLKTSVAPGVTKVRADHNLLFRILANLVTNAMKAAGPGHPVEVDCGLTGNVARFIVSDEGSGVPDEDKERIFDKYVTSGRKGPALDTGSGVGLAFCREAVAAHKGKIWVEDRPGGGSRFFVELPQNT